MLSSLFCLCRGINDLMREDDAAYMKSELDQLKTHKYLCVGSYFLVEQAFRRRFRIKY